MTPEELDRSIELLGDGQAVYMQVMALFYMADIDGNGSVSQAELD